MLGKVIGESPARSRYAAKAGIKDIIMTFEEQMLGRKLSWPVLAALRTAEAIFIALCLVYIGGAVHDAPHAH